LDLRSGETQVSALKPYWGFLRRLLPVAVGLTVVWFVMFFVAPDPLIILAGLCWLVLVVVTLAYTVGWFSTDYFVTTDRLVCMKGIVSKHISSIPLERVTSMDVKQGLLQRLCGCGDIIIDPSAQRDRLTLESVQHPAKVMEGIDRLAAARRGS
jgi:uncharacterized membrane protein YdbT with pleckstrin-like domain